MLLMRDTSFVALLFLGLKSHNRATLSHSCPGISSSLSSTNASSAALQQVYYRICETLLYSGYITRQTICEKSSVLCPDKRGAQVSLYDKIPFKTMWIMHVPCFQVG